MRSRYLAGAGAGLVFLAVSCFLFARSSEPSYRGHSLSDWLAQLRVNGSDPEATAAVQAIGTNAYRFLVERIRAEDSKIVRLARGELGLELRKHPAADQNEEAAMGFKVLGPQFRSWRPGLAQALTNASGVMPVILGEIGEPALPAVIACLTNHDSQLR